MKKLSLSPVLVAAFLSSSLPAFPYGLDVNTSFTTGKSAAIPASAGQLAAIQGVLAGQQFWDPAVQLHMELLQRLEPASPIDQKVTASLVEALPANFMERAAKQAIDANTKMYLTGALIVAAAKADKSMAQAVADRAAELKTLAQKGSVSAEDFKQETEQLKKYGVLGTQAQQSIDELQEIVRNRIIEKARQVAKALGKSAEEDASGQDHAIGKKNDPAPLARPKADKTTHKKKSVPSPAVKPVEPETVSIKYDGDWLKTKYSLLNTHESADIGDRFSDETVAYLQSLVGKRVEVMELKNESGKNGYARTFVKKDGTTLTRYFDPEFSERLTGKLLAVDSMSLDIKPDLPNPSYDDETNKKFRLHAFLGTLLMRTAPLGKDINERVSYEKAARREYKRHNALYAYDTLYRSVYWGKNEWSDTPPIVGEYYADYFGSETPFVRYNGRLIRANEDTRATLEALGLWPNDID